jgi:plastocyanin
VPRIVAGSNNNKALQIAGIAIIAASILVLFPITQSAARSSGGSAYYQQVAKSYYNSDQKTNVQASGVFSTDPGPSLSSSSASGLNSQHVHSVEIPFSAGRKGTLFDYYFPSSISVKTGETVRWENRDAVMHTVTSVAFNSGQIWPQSPRTSPTTTAAEDKDNGQTTSEKSSVFSHTFDRKGVYSYFCQIHPYMSGTVYVDAEETQRRLTSTDNPRIENLIVEMPQDAAYHYKFEQGFFIPANALATAGSRITWVNKDYVAHTATATDGSFDTEVVDPLESKSLVINEVGRIAYYCDIHPWMQASLTMTPPLENR